MTDRQLKYAQEHKMTSELEQEFFEAFGIEKIKDFNYCNGGIVEYYLKYPDITAEKLLQMICILNSIYDCGFKNNTSLASKEVKYLKMEILKHCILHKKQIKTQIQQLFKEEE